MCLMNVDDLAVCLSVSPRGRLHLALGDERGGHARLHAAGAEPRDDLAGRDETEAGDRVRARPIISFHTRPLYGTDES